MLKILRSNSNDIDDYTSSLPGAYKNDICNAAIEIWENRTSDQRREEWGTFQAFDKFGIPALRGYLAQELELNVNELLQEEGYSIKISVRQISVSVPPFRVPTQTFEIVVLDNSQSEAEDPVKDWLIEYGPELN